MRWTLARSINELECLNSMAKTFSTVRELIYWEYAKLVVGRVVGNRQQYAFVNHIYRQFCGQKMSPAAILALTSLDFLGLGVPPGTPSLGELLSQGKNSIDAWWISLSTFAMLVVTLLLLTFMGDALRDALDPRKVDQ